MNIIKLISSCFKVVTQLLGVNRISRETQKALLYITIARAFAALFFWEAGMLFVQFK